MKKRTLFILFALILLVLFSLILLITYTRHQSTYLKKIQGSVYPSIRSIPVILDKQSLIINKIQITSIDYNNQQYPIYCYQINPNKKISVLLTGSVHGEEPAGAYALSDIINNANLYSEKNKDISIDIIPVMNPWGFSTDIRFNYNGINVGVDFTSQRSSEAKAIIKYVKTKKYNCVIDLHENQSRGNFIVTYDKKDIPFLKNIISELDNNGYPLNRAPTMKFFKGISNERGICYFPKVVTALQRISSRETLFVWLLNRGISKHVYAFETGSLLKLEVRKKIDSIVIGRILDKVNEQK